ncbi:MAG: ParB/RepB/Spo0J family partition protein [Christensenellaceae bacterium]|jgi:ParB family chromosome partitioning protein|nr:ParB/RepB/Spo0J family partition protein [Christensenellaceae bacterium]
MTNKKEHLGKGLGALFGFDDDYGDILGGEMPKAAPAQNPAKDNKNEPKANGGVISIPVSQIDNNINQPRKHFDESKIKELADSIREHGVIQPILVVAVGSRYMIVAGERRWRACKVAGVKEIPAVIKNFTNKQIAEIAIIENLQRDDLNDMEVARGIKRLMDEYSLTQEKVAEQIGKTRSTVANLLRLLALPKEVQNYIEQKKLSYGHAIRLLAVENQTKLIEYAKTAVADDLSVRALGELIDGNIKLFNVKQSTTVGQGVSGIKPVEIREQENLLSRAIGTKVEISGNNKSGKVSVSYYSADEFTRITNLLFNAAKNAKKT